MFRLCHIFGVIAILAIFGLQSSEGCVCPPTHIQEQYCNSKFVILAIPTKENDEGSDRSYDLMIFTTFKADPEAKAALKSGKVYSGKHSCGVILELNETYVLMGGVSENRATIDLCGYHKLWKDVSNFQKQGIKTIYQKGCLSCDVTTCWQDNSKDCEKTKNSCVFDFRIFGNCFQDHSACIRDSTGCNWTTSPALQNCMKDVKD